MKRAYTIAMLSVIGGVLVHLMVLLVIRVEGPGMRPPLPRQAPISYVGGHDTAVDNALLEGTALLDSAPLFMPTRWNTVSEMSRVASLKEATEIFQPFSPKLTLSDARPSPPAGTGDGEATGTLRLPGGAAFILSRYGRQPDRPVDAVSAGPSCLVHRIDSQPAAPASGKALPGEVRAQAPPALWSPVLMFLQLEKGMPVGLPLISRSSGFRDWDRSLQAHATRLSFYGDFPDGYYQIWVYP